MDDDNGIKSNNITYKFSIDKTQMILGIGILIDEKLCGYLRLDMLHERVFSKDDNFIEFNLNQNQFDKLLFTQEIISSYLNRTKQEKEKIV